MKNNILGGIKIFLSFLGRIQVHLTLILRFFVGLVIVNIPRKRHVWIFGSWQGQRFSDNSKYFFLYVSNMHPDIRAIWITRNNRVKKKLTDNGYECYKANGIKGIFYSLIAKFHIIDHNPGKDINVFTSPGAICVQLWHGLPIKKIGKYIEAKLNPFALNIDRIKGQFKGIFCWSFPYVVATSEFTKKILYNAFCVNDDQVITSGYPRCDILINKNSDFNFIDNNIEEIRALIDNHKKCGHTIVGYFPTFRDKEDGRIMGTLEVEQVVHFNDFLRQNGIILFVKSHWAAQLDRSKLEVYSNIIEVDKEIDLNSILVGMDILVTDYSGVYFDFLLLDRPIVFYVYDFVRYQNEDRGFLFDYNKYTAGAKVADIIELKNEILNLINRKDRYEEQRKMMRRLFFECHDGGSSQRLFRQVCAKLY